MKICFYNPNLGSKNPVINSIFGGMYKSFWQALEKHNIEILFTEDHKTLSGDVLVVPLGGFQERSSARAMSNFNGPVVTYVPPANSWFYSSFLKRWKNKIIFAYGTDASLLSFNKYSGIGIPYYHFPFASDEKIFKPLSVPKIYDIIFVGNYNSGYGRFKYVKQLIDLANKKEWKVLLIGAGWESFGHPYQIIAHGPLLNYVYNSGKICLNIHNDTQYLGDNIQLDANNRIFDLAMAGCFQVNNAKQLIRLYFNEMELVAEDNPAEWLKCVEYFLGNDSERIKFARNARIKALSDHTWDVRSKTFIEMIESNITKKSIQNSFSLFRFLDKYAYPLYQLKQIKIIKKILHKNILV